MERLKIKTETTTTVELGGKDIHNVLIDVCDLCHKGLEESTPLQEKCEVLYEDNKYEECYSVMEDRVSTLEGTLNSILTLLGD